MRLVATATVARLKLQPRRCRKHRAVAFALLRDLYMQQYKIKGLKYAYF